MLSKFFIERPIFATVLAIIVMAVGIFRYKISQLSDIQISRLLELLFLQLIVVQMLKLLKIVLRKCLNNRSKESTIYCILAHRDASGNSRISLFFEQGTDPDQAQVQVQNAVNGAINRLPEDVQRQRGERTQVTKRFIYGDWFR
jgi:hypothetical protein